MEEKEETDEKGDYNESVDHSKTYIDLVSCKPFKKTSLPPLKYKFQDQLKHQISIMELNSTENIKR